MKDKLLDGFAPGTNEGPSIRVKGLLTGMDRIVRMENRQAKAL
jgi:hypothetical protein